MEKRLPLALFLMFLVFFGWTLFFPREKTPPIPAPSAPLAGGAQPEPSAVLSAPLETPLPSVAEGEERELELRVGAPSPAGAPIRPGAYRALFSNRGARLVELDLADYVRHVGLDEAGRADPANWLPLVEAVETPAGQSGSLLLRTSASSRDLAPGDLDRALWEMEELAAPEVGVRFRYGPPGGKVLFEKLVAFVPGTWNLRVSISLQNIAAGAAGARDFVLVPAGCVPPELADTFYKEPNAVAIGRGARPGEFELDSEAAGGREPGGLDVPRPLVLAGVHNKYFAFLLRDSGSEQATLGGATYVPLLDRRGGPPLIQVEVPLNLALPEVGATRTFEYLVYAGPKAPAEFTADFAPHQLVLDDDLSVDAIAKGLLYVLRLLDGLVGNWGVAIILLTLGVRLMLFPLNRRAQTAMGRYQKKMKRVQPRLEEVKKRFENDPQKLREAQARIMQEEGAFPPLGGCLPVFLQMPVFFGLFSALRTSFDLRQAPFFAWIHDLSRPDQLLELGLELPILPDIQYLNVLPILMVVLWVLQQMGMPKPADEQAARMQKMMMFMPLVFGVMLYNYAAGLSLYMMTTSGLSIVEQRVIKKLWPIDDTEPVKKKGASGCGPFSGVLQHMADKHREQLKRVQAMQTEQRKKQQRKK